MSDLLFKLWRINVLISKLNYAFPGHIGSHIFDDCRSPVTHVSAKKDVSFTTEEKRLYLLQMSIFLELRKVSQRYDKPKHFTLI